eukprot:m.277819 g.277819  ORF g.277819 m.277819 type:complete len:986 (+) comp17713_c0_seq1:97-3054(+)
MFSARNHSEEVLRGKILDGRKQAIRRLKALTELSQLADVNAVKLKTFINDNKDEVYKTVQQSYDRLMPELKQRTAKSRALTETQRSYLFDYFLGSIDLLLDNLPETLPQWRVTDLAALFRNLLYPNNSALLRNAALRLYFKWLVIIQSVVTDGITDIWRIALVLPKPTTPSDTSVLVQDLSSQSHSQLQAGMLGRCMQLMVEVGCRPIDGGTPKKTEVECSGFTFLLDLFRRTQLPKFYSLPQALMATETSWSKPTSEALFAIELIGDHTLHEVIVRNIHNWFTSTSIPFKACRQVLLSSSTNMALVHALFSVTLAKQYTQRRANRPASEVIRRLRDASSSSSDHSRRHRDRGNSVDDDTSYQLPLLVVQAYQRLLSTDNSILTRKAGAKEQAEGDRRKSTASRSRLASVAERTESGDSSLDLSSSREGALDSSPQTPSTPSSSSTLPMADSRPSQASILTLVAEDNIRPLIVAVNSTGREVLQLADREALNELQRRIIDNVRRLFSEAYNYLAAAMRSNAIMGLVREALGVLQWLCMQHARSMPTTLQQHLLQMLRDSASLLLVDQQDSNGSALLTMKRQLAGPVFRTIFGAHIRLGLLFRLDNKTWTSLSDTLVQFTDWEALIEEWEKAVRVMTAAVSTAVRSGVEETAQPKTMTARRGSVTSIAGYESLSSSRADGPRKHRDLSSLSSQGEVFSSLDSNLGQSNGNSSPSASRPASAASSNGSPRTDPGPRKSGSVSQDSASRANLGAGKPSNMTAGAQGIETRFSNLGHFLAELQRRADDRSDTVTAKRTHVTLMSRVWSAVIASLGDINAIEVPRNHCNVLRCLLRVYRALYSTFARSDPDFRGGWVPQYVDSVYAAVKQGSRYAESRYVAVKLLCDIHFNHTAARPTMDVERLKPFYELLVFLLRSRNLDFVHVALRSAYNMMAFDWPGTSVVALDLVTAARCILGHGFYRPASKRSHRIDDTAVAKFEARPPPLQRLH